MVRAVLLLVLLTVTVEGDTEKESGAAQEIVTLPAQSAFSEPDVDCVVTVSMPPGYNVFAAGVIVHVVPLVIVLEPISVPSSYSLTVPLKEAETVPDTDVALSL